MSFVLATMSSSLSTVACCGTLAAVRSVSSLFGRFDPLFFCTDIVQMHIETLDAVQRESKRLPPIQKVTNSKFYIGLDTTDKVEPQAGRPTPTATPTPPYSTHITTESECHSRYVCVTAH